jgi:bacterial leucyl aminopeptidase
MKRPWFTPSILALWLAIVSLACNLTSSSVPPTLVPRATALPPPTIGYATIDPTQLSIQEPVATTTPAFEVELYTLMNQVESDRLIVHIDTLQNFETRHVNSSYTDADQGIGAAYNYIVGQFQSIQRQSSGRLVVTTQDFSLNWGGIRSTPKNILAILNGTEPGAGVIVVGAHYDSRIGNLEDGTGYAPGANDNGSGIAALIEIARIMSLSNHSHRATVIFIAFSAEEEGRLGSIAFVRDYIQKSNIPVTAVVNLDIIGSSTNSDGSINDHQIRLFSEGPDESASRQLARAVNFITYNYDCDLEVVIQEVDDRSGSYGDHLSFSQAGYAAVRFTEMNEEPQRRHTERDTIDDVQAGYLVKATRTILTVVVVLTDGPRPPSNMTLRDNGDGTRRLVWEQSLDAVNYIVALRPPGSLVYQQFTVTQNMADWDGFVPERFSAVAVVPIDASGLMGPPSPEYAIGP